LFYARLYPKKRIALSGTRFKGGGDMRQDLRASTCFWIAGAIVCLAHGTALAAQTTETPVYKEVVPPPPIIPVAPPLGTDAMSDPSRLRLIAEDLEKGISVFVDTASVDRGNIGAVKLKTVEIYRTSEYRSRVKYERADQVLDCSGTGNPFLRKMNWIRATDHGDILQKKVRPGHIREAVPGTVDEGLWQWTCHGGAATSQDEVTGVVGAVAVADPRQDAADDIRNNGDIAARDDDPGRALYVATRARERGATSVSDLALLVADYTKAADLGSRQATWRLVWINLAQNSETGFVGWLRKLADAGDARAQVAYARYLMKSQPCDAARTYVQKAADQGVEDAELLLGMMMNRGQCGSRDAAGAVVWFEKAARQGSFYGQVMLGQQYETGNGVKASPTEAGAWYLVAAGHSPWEEGIDQYVAELDLAHVRAATPALIPGMGNYRDRARELCRQDKVCKLVVVKDVGEPARMSRASFDK
jgi:hypothetical protein